MQLMVVAKRDGEWRAEGLMNARPQVANGTAAFPE
jgi:hypothetical protein